MSRINVRIDRLVIHDMPAGVEGTVASGFSETLEQLLQQPRAAAELARFSDASVLRLGDVSVGAVAGPREIGGAAARRIVREFLP